MYTIMIVDDEFAAQDMIRRYVETKMPQYRVLHVCNHGKEALEAFLREPADILLVDIRMPVMDGLTFLEKLGEITQDYAALILSSYNEFEYAKTAIGLGVSHYLLKPVDFKELDGAIRKATQQLEKKRAAFSPVSSTSEEKQEIFFDDLLLGKYETQDMAAQAFKDAMFPFSYGSVGTYMQINVDDAIKWNYGQDELITAIKNVLSLLYHASYCICVNKSQSLLDFVLIGHKLPNADAKTICTQTRNLVKILISVKKMHTFDSVEELCGYFSREERRTEVEQMEEAEVLPEATLKQRIFMAAEYIREHYVEDLSRDELAQLVYISPAHFSRCFKEIMGVSYKDYLTEIRMQQAIKMLATQMKVTEIANRVGYQNNNRFNINFRQYTGYTPTEYRTNVLKMILVGGGVHTNSRDDEKNI